MFSLSKYIKSKFSVRSLSKHITSGKKKTYFIHKETFLSEDVN